MQTVKVGNQTLLFPDSMTQDQIKAVVRDKFGNGTTPAAPAPASAPAPAESSPTNDVSWLDEAAYAWDSTNADYENWAVAVEAKFGLGEVRIDENGIDWKTAEEMYPGWNDMSYSERKEFLLERERQAVEEEYADVIAFQEETGGSASAEVLGSMAKTLATPTSLFPFGQTMKGAAAMGGVVAAQAEMARQEATEDYSVEELLKQTTIGTGAGVAANRVETMVRGMWAARQNVKASKAANNKIAAVNEAVEQNMVKGMSKQDAINAARDDLGLKPEEMYDVAASGKMRIPEGEELAKLQAAQQNPAEAMSKTTKLRDRVMMGLTDWARPISSRIREMDEGVFGAVRKLEANVHQKTAANFAAMKDFMKAASKYARQSANANYRAFERLLYNGDRTAAKQFAMDNGMEELAEQVDVVGAILDDIYRDLSDAGIKVEYTADYFPRKVKDLNGLRGSLGDNTRGALDGYLRAYARKQGLSGAAELSKETREELTNLFLSGKVQKGQGLSITKQRQIEEVTEAIQPYYYDAAESLMHYVHKSVREAEKARFFGKNVVKGKDGKIDVDMSIGKKVEEANLTPEQKDDLNMLLQVRFNEGEQVSSDFVSGIRSIQTAALLGQLDSALIQLADIGSSIFMNGFLNTVRGLGKYAGKKGVTNAEELGVIQNIAADIEANGLGAKFVDNALKFSGFRAIDRLGKDTFINAAYLKNTQQALKSPEKIRQKWGKVFGDETPQLIDDLKNGRVTDNVKLLLFNELADVQPIALSEMPQIYLANPNGRIVYALKSFALKQLDLVRREAIKDMQNPGTRMRGFTRLMQYGAIMGLSGGTVGTVRDWMQTKEFRPEQMPDKSFETLMGIMFLNEYTRNKHIVEGDVEGFVINLLAPAGLGTITETVQAGIELAKDEEDQNPDKFAKAAKNVPVLGKAAYYWLFGGAEKKLERERKEEIREARRKAGIN